jgi:hypothetical protein
LQNPVSDPGYEGREKYMTRYLVKIDFALQETLLFKVEVF